MSTTPATRLVCLTCRQNKIKCVPSSQEQSAPCARCLKKGLYCQYMAIPDPTSSSSAPATPYNYQPTHSPATPVSPQLPASAPTSPYVPTTGVDRSRFRPILPVPVQAPSLPQTGPPPEASHPRYAAGQYPDLSLTGSDGPPDYYLRAYSNAHLNSSEREDEGPYGGGYYPTSGGQYRY
ncbi:Zn(2)-C6 fungal-type domain-containing protein [Mycena indigotica]|uniref:Zn(2)-C6 fungal-type domain-containing protein n=1 Tax=Mycena indigotica TaxID=2126181 RepID=A0A8H6T6J1_9AGAR|nr:Zn(2)-C6 fungal-type domain-containing protein [Mycena indigotica]KAF7312703.1 Zn(2)-C6 fungal-type domain-containing protein [Mycena indigotica]